MTPLVLSEPLLNSLRARRDEQRQRRAGRIPAPRGFFDRLFSKSNPSLMHSLNQLFSSRRPDISNAAAQYVSGMDFLQDEVENEHDAFLLDPGMGPMIYLTADGRILFDERSWDGKPLREAQSDEVVSALVVGAKKTGIAGLLELLPSRPHDGLQCPKCHGSRWARLVPTFEPEFVCLLCGGLGWATSATIDAAVQKGTWASPA